MGLNTNYANRIPSRIGISIVEVFTIDNLPAPATNVITLADNTVYKFLNDVDVGANQLKTGDNTAFLAVDSGVVTLSGTTTLPLIITNGTDAFSANHITLSQLGSGELIEITTGATAVTGFTACNLVGGDIRCISGLILTISRSVFVGARIIQDATGGIGSLNFDTCPLQDAGPVQGLVKFETGSSTDIVVFLNSTIFMNTATSIGFLVEQGAIIGKMDLKETNFNPIAAGSVCICVENPDAISFGGVFNGSKAGAGNILECTPISSSNFASPDADPRDIGFDGTNLLSCDPSTAVNASVYLHTGITSSITTTLTDAVFTGVRGVAWARGNLLSITDDGGTGTIRVHDGFSTTVDDSFATPAANPVGITYDGTNIISLDSTTGVIYVHDGLSDTILLSLTSPAGTDSSGISYNGINILISDSANNLIYVFDFNSASVKYSFSGPGTLASGIAVTNIGAVVSDSTATATIYEYDHPVIFDQSSATWQMDNTNSLSPSSDRGGSTFETADSLVGVSVAVVQNAWTDIEDGGTSIFYGSFEAMEKCHLEDETNGEINWTGSRESGRSITGVATFSRAGGGVDVSFELGVAINGIIHRDSVTRAVLSTSSEFITMNTIPITRGITTDETIKIQIRNLSSTDAPAIVAAKVAIN